MVQYAAGRGSSARRGALSDEYLFRRAFCGGLYFACHHSGSKRERAQSSCEHKQGDDEFGRRGEQGGYPGRQSHGRDCGHALERYVAESNLRRFYRADDERRGQHEEEIDGEQRHRLFDQRQVESAFADDDVLMSADGRVEPEEDDDHRRDLDAARGGTAVAAYEHQYLHKQNTAVRKLRKSDGVEARRPRRDRLEEADEKTFAGALSFQHAAAVFERKEQQCGHEH